MGLGQHLFAVKQIVTSNNTAEVWVGSIDRFCPSINGRSFHVWCQNAGGIALWIIVDHQHPLTCERRKRSDIHHGSGFANTTLLVGNGKYSGHGRRFHVERAGQEPRQFHVEQYSDRIGTAAQTGSYKLILLKFYKPRFAHLRPAKDLLRRC